MVKVIPKQQGVIKKEPKIKHQQVSVKEEVQSNPPVGTKKKVSVKEEVQSNPPAHSKKKKSTKKNRIIIRNLVIDINEKHLRKLLSPFGQILQINIPKNPDRNISKGYAFVQFKNKNDCNKVLKQLNNTIYKGRTIILDYSVDRQSYLAQKIDQEEHKQPQLNQPQLNQPQLNQPQHSIPQVDQKASKVQNEKQQNEQQQKQQQKQQEQEEDLSPTIFIRNLSGTIDDQKLYQQFRKYGKIKYARVCINKDTGLSKGSAFIKFIDSSVAAQLVQYSRSYQMAALKKLHHFVADSNINLQLDGKIIKIFSGQSRKNLSDKIKSRNEDDQPKEKKISIKKIRKIQDILLHDPHNKRNLKLALLGMWRVSDQMNKYDYEKFKNHEREKLEKLKNPNHFVSPTRVILKFLDKTITEEEIRQVTYKFLTINYLKRKQIKYCKLMLDKNMEKSAGFAFLQFSTHQISLKFINYIQDNPQVLMKDNYVCEFTIQDSRKLLKKTKHISKNTNNK